ncbi:hypothetical protein ES332_D13G221800v1 [Gossypium tomentosum]|uniref:AMP-dependent synthetase/ligase domain-containing protein n=1 Tax=Gossypium tomentosum TaxID=34277 RepID=A0A5D2I1Q6_GOSTO|nr:hypothetical protein ES332_D13G221800v1 [Gossypium tomentosum]
MAESTNHCQSIDPATGFCSQTRTFHSLRPKVPLPPPYQPLSLPQYTLSLLRSSTATTGGGDTTSNDVALILSPPSLHVPLIYFALMSLGIVISPANPLSSDSEIAHQVQLSKSIIAFATSTTSTKLLSLKHGTILLDSSEFISLLSEPNVDPDVINRVQGPDPPHPVSFFTVPLFYVFGFFMLARAFSMGETTIFTERFEFEGMLSAMEKYKVTYMPVSPPLVLALTKSDLTNKYDISSLLMLGSGGAPLGKEVAERFREKFPTVELCSKTGGGVARVIGPEETARYGTVGRLSKNTEAKIVDPLTGEALPPGQRGELWLRGPTVMNGYIGDEKATAETMDSEGWLKTRDICDFDPQGFLYIVDRLKELIKYKAYQVPPAEFEHLLHSHPEISDAVVPDEEARQIPMAYIVAPYKKIRLVAFIDSIPKSPVGKILRRELVNHSLSAGLSKL